MKTVAGAGRRSVAGKDVYVAIGVYKESWQVTVRTDGEVVFSGRVPGQKDGCTWWTPLL